MRRIGTPHAAPVSSPVLRRLLSATVAVLLTSAGAGLATPASAQNSDDLAAQVDRIVAKRNQLGEQISILDERANLARARLAELNERAGTNRDDVDEAESSMDTARQQVRRYAVRAFTDGMDGGAASAHENPTDAIRSRTLLQTAQGNKEQSVDRVRAAKSDLASKQQLLEDTAAEQKRVERRIREARAEMEDTVADLEATEAQVQGDLAAALDREEKARVAAEKAEAQRRQAEEAAAERAAAESATGNGSSANGSSDSASADTTRSRSSATTVASKPTSTQSTPTRGTSAAQPSAAASPAPRATTPPTTAPKPVAVAPPAPPPAASSTGQRAVAAAMSVRGTPYRWAGASPSSGFDCSGLVLWAYAQAGRPGLPHSSRMLVSMGRRISVGQLQPGDLVAYGSPVHHIGIYIGGGQYVHAPRTGDVVKVASIYRFNGTPIAVRI
ncbi:MAG: NlpC/P60 family protein [Microthrixaceae bacterium]